MNRILNAALLGISFTMLTACVGAPDSGDDAEPPAQEEQIGQAGEGIMQCHAPINADAAWVGAANDCEYASLKIVHGSNLNDPTPLVNSFAAIDHTTYFFFCYPGYSCVSSVSGIAGQYYQSTGGYHPVSVTIEGVVTLGTSGVPGYLQITPTSCSATGSGDGGVTTIVGTGSDGQPYTVLITNTIFC